MIFSLLMTYLLLLSLELFTLICTLTSWCRQCWWAFLCLHLYKILSEPSYACDFCFEPWYQFSKCLKWALVLIKKRPKSNIMPRDYRLPTLRLVRSTVESIQDSTCLFVLNMEEGSEVVETISEMTKAYGSHRRIRQD